MGQFIKLPKSKTDLTSFDLMNIERGTSEVLSTSNTTLTVKIFGLSCGDDTLPSYQILVDSAMSDSQRLDMINNVSKAIVKSTQSPNSTPSLEMVGDLVVSSMTYDTNI